MQSSAPSPSRELRRLTTLDAFCTPHINGTLYSIKKMKKRNPIIAGITSILFTGFGQLYNGQIKKAIQYLILPYLIILIFGLTGLYSTFAGMIAFCATYIAFVIYVLIDSIIWAKKQREYKLKPINNWRYYIGFIATWYLLVSTMPNLIKEIVKYEAFEIPTPSMEPSVMVGDRIMATKIKPEEIEIGDLITFTKDDGQKYLSRAVGLPGQTIEIKDDKVIVNGKSEIWEKSVKITSGEYEYQTFKSELPNGKQIGTQKILKFRNNAIPPQEISNRKIITIPDNQVYVLGDNRNNSMDSRMYGNVEFESIDKQVHYIWWSNDISRIGKSISK